MFDVSGSIHLAQSQVGYHEGYAAGHWNNVQKYSEQVPGLGWSDGQPWCATFVQWCLWQDGVNVPSGARSASCGASVAAYKAAGRFTEYPVTGAQIFFGAGGGEHCGIVTGWDGTNVFTVEGNTSGSGGAEGDGVYVRQHVRRDAYVYGYGVPFYHSKGSSPDPKWNGRDLSV